MEDFIINSPWLTIGFMIGAVGMAFYFAVMLWEKRRKVNVFLLLMWLVFGTLIAFSTILDAVFEGLVSVFKRAYNDIIEP